MKESEFNRSEWVNEEIERARHWKEQGLTPEDGRGQAKLLRMELMLANAGCAQLLFQRFEENPTATPDDLKKYIQGRELVAHPKEVEKFIEEMVNKKKEVDEVIKQFSKKTEGDQQKLAKKIFRNLVPFSYWGLWKHRGVPKGPVELITDFPLALILFVDNNDDFALIDKSENVGGFLQPQSFFPSSFPYPFEKEFSCPAIVCRRPKNKNKLKYFEYHEKGHAISNLLRDTLEKSKKKVVWGNFEVKKPKMIAKRLKDLWEKDPEEAKNSLEWRQMLSYALARAKDENLAHYYPTRDMNYLDSLLELNRDVYDWFARNFKLEEKSPLHQALWQEYEKILRDNCGIAQDIAQAYRVSKDRQIIFKWVLAQIPIEKWREQLEGTLFAEEARQINQLIDIPRKRAETFTSLGHTRINLVLKRFADQCKKNYYSNFFRFIRQAEAEIKKIETEGKTT